MNETERLIAALELDKHRLTKERLESLGLIRAVRLAPTLDVCEALCRGEKVPRSRLDPEWARRYGLV